MDTSFNILKETNCNDIMQDCNVFLSPHLTSAVDLNQYKWLVENNSCATETSAAPNGGIFTGHLSFAQRTFLSSLWSTGSCHFERDFTSISNVLLHCADLFRSLEYIICNVL